MARLLLCLILPLTLLTACASPKAASAPALYECRDWPEAPEKPRTQAIVAEYLTDGFFAWKSCKEALNVLKENKADI